MIIQKDADLTNVVMKRSYMELGSAKSIRCMLKSTNQADLQLHNGNNTYEKSCGMSSKEQTLNVTSAPKFKYGFWESVFTV